MPVNLSTFCCSITPFDAKGRLDEEAAEAHFARIAAAGVNLYVGGSSPGEGYSLSEEEVTRLQEIAVKAAGGKVQVRAMGVEPRHAEEMVAFLRRAADAGVDACQIYSLDMGHGLKPQPPELESYFRAALDACPVPAILSSHAFAGYNPSTDLLCRLSDDYPKLIGVNLTTPDLTHLTDSIEKLCPRLEIHVGGPMNTPVVLGLGGNGFLSSEASLCPKLAGNVISHFKAGRYTEFYQAYGTIMALMVALRPIGASMRGVKGALRVLGKEGTYLRGPHAQLADSELELIRSALRGLAARPGAEELVPVA